MSFTPDQTGQAIGSTLTLQVPVSNNITPAYIMILAGFKQRSYNQPQLKFQASNMVPFQ